MSDNGVSENSEQQEQNENPDVPKEGDDQPVQESHSRKKRSIIDAPPKSNIDASGNAAEEF